MGSATGFEPMTSCSQGDNLLQSANSVNLKTGSQHGIEHGNGFFSQKDNRIHSAGRVQKL